MGAGLVHGKPTAKDFAATARGAAESQGPSDEDQQPPNSIFVRRFHTATCREDILRGGPGSRYQCHLFARERAGNVLGMFKLGRLLQLVALVILPLAMIAQLSGSISLGQMLQFLFAAVCMFMIGYLLQTYSGGNPS
jgi:hypothetical protein